MKHCETKPIQNSKQSRCIAVPAAAAAVVTAFSDCQCRLLVQAASCNDLKAMQ